jgi:alpha-1,4-digalacturonate transport system permease protein
MTIRSNVGVAVRFVLLMTGAIAMIFPFIWMLATSFKPEGAVYTLSLWPRPFMWENYVVAWTTFPFGRFFWNSTVIAVSATVATVYLNAMSGFAFSTYQFPFRNTIFLIFLATMMIPGQVTMIPVFLLIRDLGWLNTYWGVIVPGIASAFGTFMIRQYMLSIPRDLFEAARIDGSSELGLFHRVALPLSGPVLAAFTIFAFIGEWNQFLWPLIVLNKPSMFTVQIGLQRFVGQYSVTYTHMMAMSVLSLLPIMVVFLFFQQYLVQGIATTGIKG